MIAELPQVGNPNDDRLLARAVAKAKDAGMRVNSGLADRSFCTRGRDQVLREHEVKPAVIPSRGRVAWIEAIRGVRRRYRTRNGLEGRISQLKRNGLGRTRLRDPPRRPDLGRRHRLTHNLQRLALLT